MDAPVSKSFEGVQYSTQPHKSLMCFWMCTLTACARVAPERTQMFGHFSNSCESLQATDDTAHSCGQCESCSRIHSEHAF